MGDEPPYPGLSPDEESQWDAYQRVRQRARRVCRQLLLACTDWHRDRTENSSVDETLRRYDPGRGAMLETFAQTVARSRCLDHLRSLGHRVECLVPRARDDSSMASGGSDGGLHDVERRRCVEEGLSKLPSNQRIAILNKLRDLPNSVTAAELDCSVDMVTYYIRKAKARLRVLLAPCND